MVAQPPFSVTDRRFHDETLLNSTNFAGASAWCWNFSTLRGASTATTAVSARWVAIFSAVLPSVHPSDENPTTVNTTAPATAPHTAGFTPGWIFMGEDRLGNYSDDAGPARLSISATVLVDQAVGALLPRKPVKITIAPSRARSQAMSRPSLSSLR